MFVASGICRLAKLYDIFEYRFSRIANQNQKPWLFVRQEENANEE